MADDSCHDVELREERNQEAGVGPYFSVMLGSALGGLLRYTLIRLTLGWDAKLPLSTIGINILGCFVIGFFGTFTLQGGRHPASDTVRLFVMVGICGGFTTFSSFSLETFDLARGGAWFRALLNVLLSVALCFGSVALGHYLAQRGGTAQAVAETQEEELAG